VEVEEVEEKEEEVSGPFRLLTAGVDLWIRTYVLKQRSFWGCLKTPLGLQKTSSVLRFLERR